MALLTDTLRALLLEVCGYTVQITEFIETEHTPKNILIRAVKKQHTEVVEQYQQSAWDKYRKLTGLFQITPCLERLLMENGILELS